MHIISRPSPNFDNRPDGAKVENIILHYTDMDSAEAALSRLCEIESKVSAHYLVAEDGRIFQMVADDKRAWHAGESHWRGINGINANSIGIEIANQGHAGGLPEFPSAQMDSVLALCAALKEKHAIADRNIIGHSDIAFLRKQDPGERFDWEWLATHGVGIFPHDAKPMTGGEFTYGDKGTQIMRLQQSLSNWGYGLKIDGEYGEKTEMCVKAFQRHYRPELISGQWDSDCAGRLALLHAMV